MSKIDGPKLQLRPLAPLLTLLSRFSSKQPRGNLWTAVASAAVASVLLYLLYLLLASRSSSASRFGIIIDGGSTGTRIHVFGYTAGRGTTMPELDLRSSAVMKVSPGLSSYSEDPERAGESLTELLEFGKRRVPKDRWGDTEIRLMATAGLRMVDSVARVAVLESCRRLLRSSGFLFQDDWAAVISGADEGIYAWVAANYALGTLGGDPKKTTGIIELGGASAQVAFVSTEPMPPEFSRRLKFGEITYNLYSNSFLHFGQNVAYESLRQLLRSGELNSSLESAQKGIFIDPCTPKGYSQDVKPSKLYAGILNLVPEYQSVAHAAGNFSECRSATLKLLDKGKDKCLYEQCQLGSAFVPKLQGRFLAIENFFYTMKFFGLGRTPNLSDLMLAGQRYCEEDWLELKKKYHTSDEGNLSRYCFSSAYIVALLHDGLGIALDDKRIGFTNQVGDIELEWAMGAFIMQESSDLSASSMYWVTNLVRDDSVSLLALFGVSVLLVFAAWLVSRWRKPQLKTIYDLEKGRYIVTRVNL